MTRKKVIKLDETGRELIEELVEHYRVNQSLVSNELSPNLGDERGQAAAA